MMIHLYYASVVLILATTISLIADLPAGTHDPARDVLRRRATGRDYCFRVLRRRVSAATRITARYLYVGFDIGLRTTMILDLRDGLVVRRKRGVDRQHRRTAVLSPPPGNGRRTDAAGHIAFPNDAKYRRNDNPRSGRPRRVRGGVPLRRTGALTHNTSRYRTGLLKTLMLK